MYAKEVKIFKNSKEIMIYFEACCLHDVLTLNLYGQRCGMLVIDNVQCLLIYRSASHFIRYAFDVHLFINHEINVYANKELRSLHLRVGA